MFVYIYVEFQNICINIFSWFRVEKLKIDGCIVTSVNIHFCLISRLETEIGCELTFLVVVRE